MSHKNVSLSFFILALIGVITLLIGFSTGTIIGDLRSLASPPSITGADCVDSAGVHHVTGECYGRLLWCDNGKPSARINQCTNPAYQGLPSCIEDSYTRVNDTLRCCTDIINNAPDHPVGSKCGALISPTPIPPSETPIPTLTPMPTPINKSFLFDTANQIISYINKDLAKSGRNIPNNRSNTAIISLGMKGTEVDALDDIDGNFLIALTAKNGGVKANFIIPFTRDALASGPPVTGSQLVKTKQIYWKKGPDAYIHEMEIMAGQSVELVILDRFNFPQIIDTLLPDGVPIDIPVGFHVYDFMIKAGMQKIKGAQLYRYAAERKVFGTIDEDGNKISGYPDAEGNFTLVGDPARAQKAKDIAKTIVKAWLTDFWAITRTPHVLDQLNKLNSTLYNSVLQINWLDLARNLITQSKDEPITLIFTSPSEIEKAIGIKYVGGNGTEYDYDNLPKKYPQYAQGLQGRSKFIETDPIKYWEPITNFVDQLIQQ